MNHEKLARHLEMLADCVRESERAKQLEAELAMEREAHRRLLSRFAHVEWMTKTGLSFSDSTHAAQQFGANLKAIYELLKVDSQTGALSELKRLTR